MQTSAIQHHLGQGWGELPVAWDSPNTLILVFGSREYATETSVFNDLARSFPNSHIVGCSSSGEIFGSEVFDKTLSVAVCRFDKTELKSASRAISGPEESRTVARELAGELQADNLSAVLILSDGLCVSGSELAAGFHEILGDSLPISGGLAGDGDKFEKTWVLHQKSPASSHVSAVGFYGSQVRFGNGCQGGWDVFGPERKVTRAEGSRLFEIDGKNALQVYKNYLGELAKDLPASALLYPLALRKDADDENRFVRTILSVDEESQSLTFAGEIPEGYLAQLMHSNTDRLVDGAATAAEKAKIDSTELLTLAISCVGRRLVMGERTEEEVEAVADVLDNQGVLVGFYSYGELSPLANGKCALHNQTMTLTTIGEVS